MEQTLEGRDVDRLLTERRAVLRREIELAERDVSGRHEQRVRAAVAAVDDVLFEAIMATLERS